MAIKLGAPEVKELRPRITVLGVGGAGGNAVNNMISSKLEGVDFIVANTDAQALAQSKAERRIQIGARITEGLGAGAKPDVGRAGAEESLEEILEQIDGSHMVFITAGMGGGTGTGAAPVIARAVREMGVLTVGVVTKPFGFEGEKRMQIAERGIEELQAFVDTLIVIPNQNLFRVANEKTTFAQAFTMADDVLHSGVRGVTDLIVMPGLINLDFADIKTVMGEMGKAMMGTGEAEGEERALRAAEAAISNPLLDDVSMKGARGVLINITGGPDMGLFEVDQAANRIRAEVVPGANIIFGGTILENMEGRIRVSVVATGMDAEQMQQTPQNVSHLRPFQKQPVIQPKPVEPARPAAMAPNPVHARVQTIASELKATPAPVEKSAPLSSMESEIFGDAEQPAAASTRYVIGEDDIPPMPEGIRPQPARVEQRRAAPEPEQPKRRFGLFGSRKEKAPDVRQEPPRAASTPRATVQVMGRSEQTRQQGAQSNPDDLFPESKKDDQFEIPAFLRRQQN
ncbi:MAG: cell division protein FtsZ [Proteobacteria bacterium]|nr:cell division protein FtsZ [Pseudomonadota bacterium]